MEKPPPPPPNVTTFCRFRGVIFDDVSSMLTSLHNMSNMHHNDFQIKSLFEIFVDLSLQCFLIYNDNNIKEYHEYDLETNFFELSHYM